MRDQSKRSHASLSRPNVRWLLEQLYPVPDPLRSHEEWERFWHLDLNGLTPEELQLERAQVVFRLTFDYAPHDWLLKRLDAIDGVMPNVA